MAEGTRSKAAKKSIDTPVTLRVSNTLSSTAVTSMATMTTDTTLTTPTSREQLFASPLLGDPHTKESQHDATGESFMLESLKKLRAELAEERRTRRLEKEFYRQKSQEEAALRQAEKDREEELRREELALRREELAALREKEKREESLRREEMALRREEIALLRDSIKNRTSSETPQDTGPVISSIKFNLPRFHDGVDLDQYLTRFERVVEGAHWKKEE